MALGRHRAKEIPVTKKEWRKPEVKVLKAGSAEANTGTKNDGSGGGSVHS
jgi:hypothetical protein